MRVTSTTIMHQVESRNYNNQICNCGHKRREHSVYRYCNVRKDFINNTKGIEVHDVCPCEMFIGESKSKMMLRIAKKLDKHYEVTDGNSSQA